MSLRVIQVHKRSAVADLRNRPVKDGLAAPLFDMLAARFPNYQKTKTILELKRPQGHPDLDELLSVATEIGALVQTDRSDTPAQVYVTDFITIPESESLAAHFLECGMYEPRFDAVDTVLEEEGLGIRYCLSRHSSIAGG